MRQRLGIAHALLGDPSVLILDEPANGLDPAGIRWMRGLLKGYAERGGTVLLSSHLLNEVELIADEMILIGNGGSSPRATRRRCSPGRRRPRSSRPRQRATGQGAADRRGHGRVRRRRASASRPSRSTVGAAAENGVVLTDLRLADGGLEDLFLELTSDTQREDLVTGPTA